MTNIYKVCSVIYRIALILIIPLTIIAQFLVAAAGHNRSYGKYDYLALIFIIITVALLTFHTNFNGEKKQAGSILRYACISFVSIGLCLELYGLYDLFRSSGFSAEENIISLVVILFTMISVMVLRGLINGKI